MVVAALFVTAEYRRGLIRLTFAATPSRGRVLAAKSVVVAAVGFIVGLLGAGDSGARGRGDHPGQGLRVPDLGDGRGPGDRRHGDPHRVASVLALAIGTIVRRSAATVAAVIVVIVLPYFFAVFQACR